MKGVCFPLNFAQIDKCPQKDELWDVLLTCKITWLCIDLLQWWRRLYVPKVGVCFFCAATPAVFRLIDAVDGVAPVCDTLGGCKTYGNGQWACSRCLPGDHRLLWQYLEMGEFDRRVMSDLCSNQISKGSFVVIWRSDLGRNCAASNEQSVLTSPPNSLLGWKKQRQWLGFPLVWWLQATRFAVSHLRKCADSSLVRSKL